MPPTGPPTEQEIRTVARRTIDIIESNITRNVCLFGSAASSLWADIGRVPKDIDIVVTVRLDPEDIKQRITAADDRYFLRRSRQRGATHRILFCRLPGWRTDERCVKVDILVPPTLGLPNVYARNIFRFDDIPVMPLFELLVMKTKGWWDHHTSSREDYRAKEASDVTDIYALLDCAESENVSYLDEAQDPRHQHGFMDLARVLPRKFANIYGRHRQWKGLGFPL